MQTSGYQVITDCGAEVLQSRGYSDKINVDLAKKIYKRKYFYKIIHSVKKGIV
jgi:hypothetical protein